MERQPIKFKKDIKSGTVAELKKIINAMPESMDNLQVWLGSDSGEGYTSLRVVMAANAKFCYLDGDEACGSAYNYFNDDEEGQEYTLDTIPAEYTFVEKGMNDVIIGYKDVLLLGDGNTEESIKYNVNSYEEELKKKKALELKKKDPVYIEYMEAKKKFDEKYGK